MQSQTPSQQDGACVQTAQEPAPATGRWLHRLRSDSRGFAGAEAALLAVILCGICIVAGGILRRAAIQAATNLNTELTGSK